jgi:2-oxoisovalerate dehydrogenase E1 component beta subunit
MTQMNMVGAINDALRSEMRNDDRVVLLGEDIGLEGGVFRVTAGLQKEFGEERVIDTPLAETGIVGSAIGMALNGLRPVPEIQFADFIYPAVDQLISEAAKYRYRSGGEFTCPMVVRVPVGGGIRGGHYHSQSPESLFIHAAGLKVVCPSNPYDAKGLLLSAIRDNDPVLFFEQKSLYATKGEVPDGEHIVPLGKANVIREGSDVTIVALAAMVPRAMKAAETLQAEHGINATVIDVRSLVPLDTQTILREVAKTGRLVTVEENPRLCGWGAEIASIVAEELFWDLDGPIVIP